MNSLYDLHDNPAKLHLACLEIRLNKVQVRWEIQ
jgi:hypothetical protein